MHEGVENERGNDPECEERRIGRSPDRRKPRETAHEHDQPDGEAAPEESIGREREIADQLRGTGRDR